MSPGEAGRPASSPGEGGTPASSAGQGGARAWLRPSFADLLGVFLVALVALIGGHRLFGDADAATHVATGRWILEHRQVPRADPFSGTHAGGEWFAHEWLADLLSALAHRACGWNGLVASAALIVSLAHVLLFRFLVRRGDEVLAAFGAVVAAAAAGSSHWLARPHLLTVLFLAIAAILLEQVVHGRWRKRALLALPPLVLVWANVHGGFLVAFGVVACYGAGALLVAAARSREGRMPAEAARARALVPALVLTLLASGACALVNPWGWRLPRHLVGFFAVRGPALRATSEFAPAAIDDRAGIALVVFAGLCAAGIAAGVLGRPAAVVIAPPPGGDRSAASGGSARTGPFHPGTLLALAMTTGMAFASIRHVDVMAVFGALVISDGLSPSLRMKSDEKTRELMRALRDRERRCGGGVFALALAAVWILALGGLMPPAGFDPAQFPVRAVAALREEGPPPPGPIFTPDVWGGYLILEWPQARVFVDARWDMRGDAFFQRYAAIYLAQPGWSSALDAQGVTLALLPRDAPLAGAMQASGGWERRRADETAVVFRRRAALRTP